MIFRFLMPGLLPNRKQFEQSYKLRGSNFQEQLVAQLSPFILRRTKSDVAPELPDKVQNELACPLSVVQKTEYNAIVGSAKQAYGNKFQGVGSSDAVHVLAILTRLRQVCCDASLLPGVEQPWRESGKLTVLVERLHMLAPQGRRVVIFSQFVELLKHAAQAIVEELPELKQFMLTGSTKNRESIVSQFQDCQDSAIMLVSLKAGGTGITLHNADYVFLLDPWWNPAVENQAIDRVHRIGQDKTVFVYRLIAPNTVEEKIQQLKQAKQKLLASALKDTNAGVSFGEEQQSLKNLIELLNDTNVG